MNDLTIIGLFLLYLAIGIFVARLMGEEDYPGFAMAFWPIIVGLWIAMLVIVMFPCWLADLIKNGGKKK